MLSIAARTLLRAPLLRAAAPRAMGAMAVPAMRMPAVIAPRMYSTETLSKSDISNRILEVLKSFEKVDPNSVTTSSAFSADLGLDSLDAVEVVMAIEEEFNIEIPDAEADEIQTVQQAIDYISKTPEAS